MSSSYAEQCISQTEEPVESQDERQTASNDAMPDAFRIVFRALRRKAFPLHVTHPRSVLSIDRSQVSLPYGEEVGETERTENKTRR